MNKRIKKKKLKQHMKSIMSLASVARFDPITMHRIIDIDKEPIAKLFYNRMTNAYRCLLRDDVKGFMQALGFMIPQEDIESIDKLVNCQEFWDSIGWKPPVVKGEIYEARCN